MTKGMATVGPWLAGAVPLLLMGAAVGDLPAQEMQWEDYDPRSTLEVPEHPRTKATFPFVDVHSHHWNPDTAYVHQLVRQMDAMNMAVAVNLSGGSGESLRRKIEVMEGLYPNRFVTFANLDFEGIGEPGWGEAAADQLERDVAAGARGLKIFKNFGMSVRDTGGERVPVDDPRVDPVWERAGELGIPVLIHTADPAPFWEAHDRFNERWFELKQRPRRKRGPDDPAPWERLVREQWHLFERHPGTTFINAHLGWMGNDLARLGSLLDAHPNVYTELGAVLAELGRQPRTAREWLIRYQDRVLMGKDSWEPSEYHVYFRTLETADEYFPYYRKRHAFWRLYGLDLPDPVLRKVYYGNAARIIPGLDSNPALP